MNPTTNGQTRKTLSAQLDRLDSILDGLSEALSESVAAAVKEATAQAVQQAVQATLTEILTSPELLTLIGAARAPAPVTETAPPPAASPAPGLRDRFGSAVSWARQKLHAARAACSRRLSALRPRLLGLWGLRRQLLIAVTVGGVSGLVAYAAGSLAAGLLGAAAGFTAALAARAFLWLRCGTVAPVATT